MPSSKPISTPAPFAPAFAVGFSDAGDLAIVDSGRPLPVTSTPAPLAAAAPLSGTASGTAAAGPFVPVTDRPVVMTLSGTWQGRVSLRRSVDGGVTRVPVTVGGMTWGSFTGNVCEPVWQESEAGAALYLDIALTSGTVTYRLAQ